MATEEGIFARRGRRIAAIAAVLVLGPMLAFGLGLLIVPAATFSLLLHGATQLAGLGPSTFKVEKAGLSGVELAEVAIGPSGSITARHVAVDFGKLGILSGIKRGAIDGLTVRVSLGGGAGTSSGKAGPPRLPALRIPFPLRLTDFEADIQSPTFRFSARSDGVLLLHDGISGRLSLELVPLGATPAGLLAHEGDAVFGDGAAAPVLQLHFAPKTGGSASGARITADLTLSGQSAPFGLVLGLRDMSLPQRQFSLGSLSLKGALSPAADGATVKLDTCGAIAALSLGRTILDRASLCPLDAPLLSLSAAAHEALRFALALQKADIRRLSARGAVQLAGTLPQLAVGASSDLGATRLQGTIEGEGGALSGPAALGLRDIVFSAQAEAAEGRLTQAAFTLTRAVIAGTGSKPWLAPVTLKGDGRTDGGQFRFALDGAGGGYDRLLHAEGRADLQGQGGEARFALLPIQFGPTTFAPEGLFPGLSPQVSDAKGRLSANGSYAWDAKGVRSGGTMSLAALGARVPQGQVSGLSGTLALSGLVPLATASPQTLRVARLDFGLPLTDGILRFSIDPDGTARIHEGHLDWLGGRVGVSSGTLSLTGKPQSLTFALDGVDLEKLLELAKVKGLSGTGRISGRIPVTIEGGHQMVSAGTLSSDPPGGTLAYKTGQASGNPTNPTALLYTALDDFHYDRLTGDLSGDLAGKLSLRVHLKGRNPALYDGRQVELNVSTEGAFVDMVRKSLYGYRTGP